MRLSAVSTLALVAACSNPGYVVVTLDVPAELDEHIQSVRRLAIGSDRGRLDTSMDASRDLDGFTFSVEGTPGDARTLWVEARDGNGDAAAVGRGRGAAGRDRDRAALARIQRDDASPSIACRPQT